MADHEHLDILKRGVETWNRWRQEHPDIQPDLSNASLRRTDLSGIDLRGAYLSEADLTNADLSDTNLVCSLTHKSELPTRCATSCTFV